MRGGGTVVTGESAPACSAPLGAETAMAKGVMSMVLTDMQQAFPAVEIRKGS